MSNFIKEIKHLGEKYAIVLDTSSSPEGLTFVTDNDLVYKQFCKTKYLVWVF